jgi:hypothetical protein
MRLWVAVTCLAAFGMPWAALESQDTTRTQKLGEVTVTEKADVISTRLAGFERRRLLKPGSVTFFTGEEITKRGTIRLSDALRRAHGVRIVDSQYLTGQKLVASSRMELPSGGAFARRPTTERFVRGSSPNPSPDADLRPCVLQVAVDGQLKERSFSVDEISVTDVHGIEVYPGASSLPSEFGSMKQDGWCGLVMIWTRAR